MTKHGKKYVEAEKQIPAEPVSPLAAMKLLKDGVINYLIGQRPAMQGYSSIMMLVDKLVFKRDVPPFCYMPVDILIKENIDYYVESYNL